MPAYVIAQLAVHDVETYKRYALQVAKTVEPFGGRLIVASDESVVLEGAQPHPRTVIGEFTSGEQARAWYESTAYQSIQPLRASSSSGTVYIVEGFSLPQTPQSTSAQSSSERA